jgi:hypothetical protein
MVFDLLTIIINKLKDRVRSIRYLICFYSILFKTKIFGVFFVV